MKRPSATGQVQVSDHAVLRYLERVGGFDIDGLRAAIAARVRDAADAGATAVLIDGCSFCLSRGPEGPVVSTTYKKQMGRKLHIKPEDRR
jgi:hypothetical protein